MKYTDWQALDNDERKALGWHRHPRIPTATILSITFILAFIIIVFGISKNSQVHLNRKPLPREAYEIATTFVRESLKQPTTASFPHNNFKWVIDTATNNYQINSTAKSLNENDKTVNSSWQIKMKYLGGDWSERRSWKVLEITLNSSKYLQ